MELELGTEKHDGNIVELEKAIPLVYAGPPKRHREPHAQGKLSDGRLGKGADERVSPIEEPDDPGVAPADGANDLLVRSHFHQSP
jgi:hypothetical protein